LLIPPAGLNRLPARGRGGPLLPTPKTRWRLRVQPGGTCLKA
jgi:hypothetical protein